MIGMTLRAASFMLQSANAADLEARIVARLQELEKEGVVRHDGQDSWTILDKGRYQAAMGMLP